MRFRTLTFSILMSIFSGSSAAPQMATSKEDSNSPRVPAQNEAFLLWPAVISAEEAVDGLENNREYNVEYGVHLLRANEIPTLVFYPAGEPSDLAVLVCPGGGYNVLADEHEGEAVCRWLNEQGISAGLLRYRVPRAEGQRKHEQALADFRQAFSILQTLNSRTGAPTKLGVIGFSAGGHLAIMAMSSDEVGHPPESSDPEPSQILPDFALLIYPAYLLEKAESNQLSSEFEISHNFPPSFLVVAADDPWADDSLAMFRELRQKGIPLELHVFAKGGHGFGLKKTTEGVGQWSDLAIAWIRNLHLTGSEPSPHHDAP